MSVCFMPVKREMKISATRYVTRIHLHIVRPRMLGASLFTPFHNQGEYQHCRICTRRKRLRTNPRQVNLCECWHLIEHNKSLCLIGSIITCKSSLELELWGYPRFRLYLIDGASSSEIVDQAARPKVPIIVGITIYSTYISPTKL